MTMADTETRTAASTPEEYAERMMSSALGWIDVMSAYLGDRLGWYRSLAENGPSTPAELADRTGTEVLLDGDSLNYLGPLPRLFAAVSRTMPELLGAYRHGGGVSWERLGADAREAQP